MESTNEAIINLCFFCLSLFVVSLIAWLSNLYGWVLPIELFSHFQAQYFIIAILTLMRYALN